MNTVVQTPRIIIREFIADEEAVYLNHFTDEEVCLHLPKRTMDERAVIFRNALNHYPTTKRTGTWGMFDSTTGAFIGSCLLRPFEDQKDVVELGYSMDKIWWGKGIASEMAGAMVNYAFTYDDVKEIVGVTTLENIASQKVLEKAGLVRQDDWERADEIVAFFKIGKI